MHGVRLSVAHSRSYATRSVWPLPSLALCGAGHQRAPQKRKPRAGGPVHMRSAGVTRPASVGLTPLPLAAAERHGQNCRGARQGAGKPEQVRRRVGRGNAQRTRRLRRCAAARALRGGPLVTRFDALHAQHAPSRRAAAAHLTTSFGSLMPRLRALQSTLLRVVLHAAGATDTRACWRCSADATQTTPKYRVNLSRHVCVAMCAVFLCWAQS